MVDFQKDTIFTGKGSDRSAYKSDEVIRNKKYCSLNQRTRFSQ